MILALPAPALPAALLPAPAAPAGLLPPPVMLSARLPFGGFYESLWSHEIDRELEQIVSYAAEDRDAFERQFAPLAELVDEPDDALQRRLHEAVFDATDYRKAEDVIARAYTDEFAAWIADALGMVHAWTDESWGYPVYRREGMVAFEFEEVTRPRYYNFETDRLFAKLSETVFVRMLDQLAAEAPDILADVFAELFTSRDGFISFYGNSVPGKPIAEWDHNELFALLIAFGRLHGIGPRDAVRDPINRSAASFDDELHEALHEEASRAVDAAVDWQKLDAAVAEIADELREERGLIEPRPIRCNLTLELPL